MGDHEAMPSSQVKEYYMIEETVIENESVVESKRRLSQYRITATVDARRVSVVEKKLREAFGLQEASIFTVEKDTSPESRADRLAEAAGLVTEALDRIQELQQEMQDWSDSIPENLQDGQKASDVQQTIDDLQDLIDNIEGLDFDNVSFPGMMG
jgi:hypothetical protein